MECPMTADRVRSTRVRTELLFVRGQSSAARSCVVDDLLEEGDDQAHHAFTALSRHPLAGDLERVVGEQQP